MTDLEDDWIYITDHALTRWHERKSPDTMVGPRVAWIDGVRLESPHGLDVREVRYHAGSQTLLLRKQNRLVTVLDAITVQGRARQALLRTVGGGGRVA